MSDIPRHVVINENVFDENNLNFIEAESLDDGISIGSLIDENPLEETLSIPSMAKERNEQMSVSTTEDEFEEDTTIAASENEENGAYGMTDFYKMDCSDLSLAHSAEEVCYNVTDITCPLCFYTVDGGEAIALPSCHHSVCIPCFQGHIKSSRKLSLPICCPLQCSAECSRPLGRSLIRQINAMEWLPEEEEDESNALMADTRSSVYHPCPTLGCANVVYWKEGHGPPIGDCFRCSRTCCLKCGVTPYHNQRTCQEYQTYLASLLEASMDVVPLHSRRCSL